LVGNTPRRLLHFTFDDGPHATETPRLLDALDRFGVKATFFFSASRFASAEKRNAGASELARQVAARGHAIGSHSFDHVPMARLSPPQLKEQLARSDAMFERVFGARSHLFRPPKGSRNRALEGMLEQRRDTTVMWNVGLADWVERPPQQILETFFKVLARNEKRDGDRGGIVLLHDTHSWSVDGFVLIMEALQARNCELLERGEELYEVVDSLAPFVAPAPQAKPAQVALRKREAQRCSGSSSKSARVMPRRPKRS
jgi:peptidoglycan/xylan/chitin deacetylase (PgdA/CDA1 family)